MDKKEILKALKNLYEKSLREKEYRLCLEILQEMVKVIQLTEVVED